MFSIKPFLADLKIKNESVKAKGSREDVDKALYQKVLILLFHVIHFSFLSLPIQS